jgi:hypothetical protein
MLKFNEFNNSLTEKVLSIGINPEHEKFRELHRQEMHDMLHRAYKEIGGYSGNESGSAEESRNIHKDISDSLIKATKRDGKVTSVTLYKDQHGRKSIATATDNSPQGKADWIMGRKEDISQKRSWGEVSGKPEHMLRKLGAPVIPNKAASRLIGKEVELHPNGEYYTRKIGQKSVTKVAMGFPKEN